jgi:hypothetical protein
MSWFSGEGLPSPYTALMKLDELQNLRKKSRLAGRALPGDKDCFILGYELAAEKVRRRAGLKCAVRSAASCTIRRFAAQ